MLFENVPVPVNDADTVWLPAVNAEVVYVQVAVVAVVVPAVPATVPIPCIVKFTLPVGVPVPLVLATVAVNVTESPYVEAFKLEETLVVVEFATTTLPANVKTDLRPVFQRHPCTQQNRRRRYRPSWAL